MEESSQIPRETIGGFPADIQEDIDGLMWLGYLEDEFDFCGHTFVIHTLRGEEDLMVGLLTKEYIETFGQAKATAWATVAMSLTAVDGDEDFCPPVSRDDKANARALFRYVTKWFWPLGLFIFNRHAALLERQSEAMEAVEDFYSGNLPQPMPFADSSTDRASSDPLADEILGLIDPSEEEDSAPSNNDS